MSIVTLSAREFNQHASEAKKAANLGPVFITDRGRPAHVLLSYADYQKIVGIQDNISDLLGMKDIENIDFSAPKLNDFANFADFS